MSLVFFVVVTVLVVGYMLNIITFVMEFFVSSPVFLTSRKQLLLNFVIPYFIIFEGCEFNFWNFGRWMVAKFHLICNNFKTVWYQ